MPCALGAPSQAPQHPGEPYFDGPASWEEVDTEELERIAVNIMRSVVPSTENLEVCCVQDFPRLPFTCTAAPGAPAQLLKGVPIPCSSCADTGAEPLLCVHACVGSCASFP